MTNSHSAFISSISVYFSTLRPLRLCARFLSLPTLRLERALVILPAVASGQDPGLGARRMKELRMLVSELGPTVADVCSAPGRAERLARLLERLPIGFEPGSLLAGDFGTQHLPPAEREEISRRYAEFSRPPPPEPAPAETPPPETPADDATLMDLGFGIGAGVTIGHASVDYARVIEQGVEKIVADIKAPLPGAGPEETEYRTGMILCFEAFLAFAERYAALAEELASEASQASESDRFRDMAALCRRIPRVPAETFREAAQSFWLTHTVAMLSEMITQDSMSPGRMDQYLWPYFRKDRKQGVTEESLEAVLDDLWAKFGRHCVANHNVNLGGMNAAGEDVFNDLSAMILRVAKKQPSNVPLLSVRVHPGMSDEHFRLAADPVLLKTGQPTFYGEEACRKAILRRGAAPEDLDRLSMGSCMALVIQGREYSGMWDIVVNALTPLELALNGGQPFAAEFPLESTATPAGEYRSVDDIIEKWAAYMAEILGWCVKRNTEATLGYGRTCPNPFLSALIGGIESGKDRADYGAQYHCSNCNAFGLVNASDSLVAIDQLVFRERRFSLDRLVAAAKADFDGYPEIHEAILQCPKYGNGDEQADTMAARLAERYAETVTAHARDNVHYLPSFHTLDGHIAKGQRCPASLDGRRAGEPLAKNVGTVPERMTDGVTALMLSATRIDQSAFSGGQALDIVIDGRILETTAGIDRFRALLETYFDRGGLQVQVNTVTADELRAALESPERHADLMVRVAGYSARFVNLDKELQHDLLKRFE